VKLRDAIGAGTLAIGLTAGAAVAQNQINISGSGRQFPPVPQGTVADAAGTSGALAPATMRAGFTDTGPLTLNHIVDDKYVSGLLLRNAYCGDEIVSLGAQLLDRDNRPYPVAISVERNQNPVQSSWTMAPGTYDAVVLTIGDPAAKERTERSLWDTVLAALRSEHMDYGTWTGHLPLKGELVLSLHTAADSGNPKGPCLPPVSLAGNPRRELRLQPPTPSPVDTGVILGSLALALLATGVAAMIILASKKNFLRGRMGEVTFDFTSSWGANVAIGAGLLSMLTGGTLLSQDQYSSNGTTYVVLGSLFAALVPLGAALYALIRPPVTTTTATEPQGFVNVYLLSSAIVLWGAIGQLLLIGMILREFQLARILSPVPVGLLIAISKVLIGALMFYAVRNALATVDAASERVAAGANPTARPAATMI
jgi:hypothetical protein